MGNVFKTLDYNIDYNKKIVTVVLDEPYEDLRYRHFLSVIHMSDGIPKNDTFIEKWKDNINILIRDLIYRMSFTPIRILPHSEECKIFFPSALEDYYKKLGYSVLVKDEYVEIKIKDEDKLKVTQAKLGII